MQLPSHFGETVKKFTFTYIGVLLAFFPAYLYTINREILQEVQAQPTDTTPPTTTHTITPSSPDGNNDWYVSPVQIELDATDLESGVQTIYWRINGGTWQQKDFAGTNNLAPNPSFENAGATTTGASSWEATVVDPEGDYLRNTVYSAPGYESYSIKITASGGSWHGINNQANFVTASPFDNMSASFYMRTQGVTGSAYGSVYAVSPDGAGGYIYTLLGSTSSLSGNNDWTNLTLDFTVNVADAIGVYIDMGITGPGEVWMDAVSITNSLLSTTADFTISTDNSSYEIEYYAEDFQGNIESYSCTTPKNNCIEFKLDQTPPGNWVNSGAERDLGGPDQELWVFTDVEDLTSGLSTDTDEYQYHVDDETGFGHYDNLIGCDTSWNEDSWVSLLESVDNDGDNTATLRTQKTDFCNNNWKVCKDVRFYAEDMAGNVRTKDICLNGPWVKVRGQGFVKSNAYIDMVAEAFEDNTDGLVEVGGITVDFFTSSNDWIITDANSTSGMNYDELFEEVVGDKTEISQNDSLITGSGVYFFDGNTAIRSEDIPSDFGTATFDQIVFVNGRLTIREDIVLDPESTLLFITKENARIVRGVRELHAAIISDEDIETAFNISEDQAAQTLNLYGFYVADRILLQRTLQGTRNNDTPAENFTFEPKYLIQMKDFFDDASVRWVQ